MCVCGGGGYRRVCARVCVRGVFFLLFSAQQQTLWIFVIFKRDSDQHCKGTLAIFQGGGPDPQPPSGSAHAKSSKEERAYRAVKAPALWEERKTCWSFLDLSRQPDRSTYMWENIVGIHQSRSDSGASSGYQEWHWHWDFSSQRKRKAFLRSYLDKPDILRRQRKAIYRWRWCLKYILSETSKPPLDIFSYILIYLIHTWLKFTLNMEKIIKQNLSKFHFHKLKITCLIDRLYKGTIAFHFHTNARIWTHRSKPSIQGT